MKYCNNDISLIDDRWNMIKNIYNNNNNIDSFIENINNWIDNPNSFLDGINILIENKRINLWYFLHYFYSQIFCYCYNLLYNLKDDENNELMNRICIIISFIKFPVQIEKQNDYLNYLISFRMNKTDEVPESGIIYPVKCNDSDLKCYLKITEMIVKKKENEKIIELFESLKSNKIQQLDCLMFIELFSLNDRERSDVYTDLLKELYKNEKFD